MSPVEAIKSYYKNYLNFSGRTSRSGFWWFMLYNIIVSFALIFLFSNKEAMMDPNAGMGAMYAAYGMPYWIWAIAHLIGNIALLVRRTHDWGKTGWLNLLVIIPLVGFIWVIVNGVIGSEAGANKFGPNPHGIGGADTFS